MLSESFIAASLTSNEKIVAPSAHLKDAGIFVHSFQPISSLTTALKKSSINRNCLAVSEDHVFAAQAQKAVIHVYNRTSGRHEITAHFNSRIQCLALLCDNSVLALGGEDGTVTLWELFTGRLKSTPPSHLQAVGALAADITSNFILSGSKDSNIHVWSIVDLISYNSSSNEVALNLDDIRPKQSLSAHRAEINALATGHSTTLADIALSASQDKTIVVWNYRSGHKLQTYLMQASPLCLVLDPADRAFYAGLEDGGVQFVSFYNTGKFGASISTFDTNDTPIRPPTSTLKHPDSSLSSTIASNPDIASSQSGSTLSIALSYDTSTILSGHASGKIMAWFTSDAGSFSRTVTQYDGLPITNIAFLPPEGWARKNSSGLRTTTIIKPMPHEAYSGSKGELTKNYHITAQMPFRIGKLRHRRSSHRIQSMRIAHKSEEGQENSKVFENNEDFISIDTDLQVDVPESQNPGRSKQMAAKVTALEAQVEHLKKLAVTNAKHIDELFEENESWRRLNQSEESHELRPPRAPRVTPMDIATKLRQIDGDIAPNGTNASPTKDDYDSGDEMDLSSSGPIDSGVPDDSRRNNYSESDDSTLRREGQSSNRYVVL